MTTSFGWAWGAWRGESLLAEERLDSLLELPRVLRSYATTVSTLLRGEAAGDRFNVTAFGALSGLVYGRDVWAWDALSGLYRASGEPWVPRTKEARQDVPQRASVTLLSGRQVTVPHASVRPVAA
ncbi:hypothetical protein OHB41_03775 [Streptomyces sp. NBC_01571]|uniref:hypothetical protein n=1 Tax=Streptomyces sp. NBC_01571 TaxID=2975883 RepID=UPI00224D515C|nr:hypothetical protein [Streptomyces sp. NBC_01571]MCX4572318.1 hypothetical protein [Streptomyces sp. NBC_01571]